MDIETRDGEILTSKDDIAERAAEWSDTLEWRSRLAVSSVSLILSMPAGTDSEKVLGAARALADADRRTNIQAVAVARGQAKLPPFVTTGKTRWQQIRDAYSQAAGALDATGQAEDRTLASDVRGFLDEHPDMDAKPEIFAVRQAQSLAAVQQKREPPQLDPSQRDRGRRR